MNRGRGYMMKILALTLTLSSTPLIGQVSPQKTAAEGETVVDNYSSYVPKNERHEVLRKWEKLDPKIRPEIVPGIYEFDTKYYDFQDKLAVTIDDGAPDEYMVAQLDVLKKHGIKATFFIIGNYFLDPKTRQPLPRAKELLERAVAEGHVLGSHTFSHPRLDLGKYKDDAKNIAADLDRNQTIIDSILGYHYPLVFVRPPFGAHSTPLYMVDRVLKERREFLCNWNVTSFDWCMNYEKTNPDYLTADKVISRTLKQSREDRGGVILFHGFPRTTKIFDELLTDLETTTTERGNLVFVTLRELLDIKYLGSGFAVK